MTNDTSMHRRVRKGLITALLAPALLIGCARNPTENDVPKHASEQEKARTRQAIGEQQSVHPTAEPPTAEPPTADRIPPTSPDAVLHGTSTTQPAVTPPPASTPPPR